MVWHCMEYSTVLWLIDKPSNMSTLVYISAHYYIIDWMLVISVYTVELRIVLKKCPSIDYLNFKLQLCSNRQCWQLLATTLLIVPTHPQKNN